MNKKTFAVAVLFFCVSLAWLVVNIFWTVKHCNTMVDLVISVFFFLAGVGMVYNECKKKKRRHLADVDKTRIP